MAARAAPPSIGAAVIWAAKPEAVALEAAELAAPVALEARLDAEAPADEAAPDREDATEDADPAADDPPEAADPDAEDPAPPTAVKRVVEPTVEVATALPPEDTVVRTAATEQ
jgi:hypothetical protein